MAFTSTTIVKSHLGITGTSFDTVLATLITQVDAMIKKATGVNTGAASGDLAVSQEIRDSEGTLELRTKYHPINSLTLLESRDSNNDWETYGDELIADVEYDGNKIFTRYVVAGAGERQVRITYNAGYITANVPVDLQLAATLMVAQLFNPRQGIGYKSLTQLGLTLEMSNEDFYIVKNTLTKYRPMYAF